METQPKSDDEDDEDDGKLGDSVDDVVEHEDEDAEVGHVAEVLEGVQPGEGDEEGSSWPLPASLSFAARRLKLQAEVEDKHKGEEVEKPVNEIRETEVSRKHGLNQQQQQQQDGQWFFVPCLPFLHSDLLLHQVFQVEFSCRCILYFLFLLSSLVNAIVFLSLLLLQHLANVSTG